MKGNSSIDNKGTSIHPVTPAGVHTGAGAGDGSGNGADSGSLNGALDGYDVKGAKGFGSTSKVKNVNSSP